MVLKDIKVYCIVLLGMFLLVGCGMDAGLQIKKVNMEISNTIDFMICWPEESLYGNKIKQIVDNFNLQVEKKSNINLIMVSGKEEYITELRTLAATNELPDIFINIRNNKDLFLEKSGKLMNLEPYQNELHYEGICEKNIEGDFYYKELLSMCFEVPSLRFYYLKDMANSYGYPFVSNDPKLLFKLYDHILESESGTLQIEDYIKSGEGITFLYYICAQNEKFDPSNVEDWENILTKWKHYSKVFGTFKNKYIDIKGDNNIKLCSLNYYAFNEVETEHSDLYSYVTLEDMSNQSLYGSPLCLAALKQNDKEKEKIVVQFLKSFLNENWKDIKNMDMPENKIDLYDDTTIKIIESESLEPRKKEKMNEVLNMLLMDTMECQDGARIIVELHR